MKKTLTLMYFFFSIFSFAQDIDVEIKKREQRVDSLMLVLMHEDIEDDNINYLQNARKVLKSSVNDVLKLENFNNKEMQKVLLKPLTDYYSAFDYQVDGKKMNTIRYGFELKEDFIQHYKVAEAFLLSKISKKQNEVLIKNEEKNIKFLTEYRDRNLKRLGITLEQYEKLSDNDQRILEEKFK